MTVLLVRGHKRKIYTYINMLTFVLWTYIMSEEQMFMCQLEMCL